MQLGMTQVIDVGWVEHSETHRKRRQGGRLIVYSRFLCLSVSMRTSLYWPATSWSLRRYRIPGGPYFFTVTLTDRRSQLLVQHNDRLRGVFPAPPEHQPFRLDSLVLIARPLPALCASP